MFCDYCGTKIPDEVAAHRHADAKRHFCNRLCDVAYRKQHGMYKQMSLKGRGQRSIAVTLSNKLNPRRRKI